MWNNQWNEDDADLWMHRLGNLVLLNQKVNGKISNGPFLEKRKHYKTSPYQMTWRISEVYETEWTTTEVEDNHQKIIQHAMEVWNLDIFG